MMAVLMLWSLGRIKSALSLWAQLLLLSLKDWTVVVYIVIPGLALAGYEGYRYYLGLWFTGMTPNGPLLGPISFHILADALMFVFILIIHFSTYGHVPFPLRSGDKVYVFGAPVPRVMWSTTLWVESSLWNLVLFYIVAALTLPVIWFLQLNTFLWFLGCGLIALYLSASRTVGTFWRRQEEFRFGRFVAYQSLRLAFFVPIAIGSVQLIVGHLIVAFTVLLTTTLLLTWLEFWLLRHRAWDTLFYADRTSMLTPMFTGVSPSQQSQTVFVARLPSQFVLGTIEKFRRKPLHPVNWLVLLRLFRKKGVVRDYLFMTAGAVTALHFVTLPVIRILGAGFILFLFYQYWKGSVRPLYQNPAKEQTITDRWALEVTASHFTGRIMIFTAVLWIALAFLLQHLF